MRQQLSIIVFSGLPGVFHYVGSYFLALKDMEVFINFSKTVALEKSQIKVVSFYMNFVDIDIIINFRSRE